MGTLRIFVALAGLFGIVASQEFSFIEQNAVWTMVGETAAVYCKWSHGFQNITDQTQFWSAVQAGISKAVRGSDPFIYKNSPVSQDRAEITLNWEGETSDNGEIVQSSLLEINDYTASDPTSFVCEVEMDEEKHSVIVEVRPYALPEIFMTDVEVTADLRPEPVAPDVTIPDSNATEAINNTDYNYPGSDSSMTNDPGLDGGPVDTPDYNYGLAEDSIGRKRRRRQVTSEATFDENPPTEDETKYVSVMCHINNAYPKPSKVDFVVGESEILEPSEPVEWFQDDVTKLFSGRGTLTLVADPKYDMKSVTCSVPVAKPGLEPVTSTNASTPFEIFHDATQVDTVIIPLTAIEGDNIEIQCRGDGRPEPKYSVSSDNVDIVIEEGNSPNKFVINSISRHDAGRYWCVASFEDRSNPGVTQTIDDINGEDLTVEYLDTPTVDKSSVTGTQGDQVTITCSADSQPDADFSWSKDGQPKGNGRKLFLPNLTYADAGTYVCTARNKDLEKSVTATVHVEGQCNTVFEEPTVASSQTVENTYFIKLTCKTSGNPPCNVDIVPPSNFELVPKREPGIGSVTWTYESVKKLSAPLKFACVASNQHTPKHNKTVTIGKDSPACCVSPQTGGISPGAIVGILLLVLVVVIGIPVACYCVKKRNTSSSKKASTDEEAPASEKEGLHKEASSEDSDTGSLPPPPADDVDHRMNSSHEMTTFSTNQHQHNEEA